MVVNRKLMITVRKVLVYDTEEWMGAKLHTRTHTVIRVKENNYFRLNSCIYGREKNRIKM